ncbi:MAG: insulinase family protein [Clostridia bacterium]|nr:insulinase family protein [Clostridia bacterium]
MIPTVHSPMDGVTLRVCRTEKFKSNMLSVSAVLPIQKDSVYKTSLLFSVLRRGSCRYPTLADLNARLDYLYGTEIAIHNFYRGDSQIVGFSAELLGPEYLPQGASLLRDVLEVLCQILFHPLLDGNGNLTEKYVESEKKLQCDAIRALKNNPRAYATARCRELIYQDEPCGLSPNGREEEVMAVTPAELTQHWQALLQGLSLDCFYVGNQEPAELTRALQDTLGRETFGDARQPRGPLCRALASPKETPLRAEEELPVSQGHLMMGFRTNATLTDPGFSACVVMNELLGVSPISKLFVNVREKLSLCYSCGSSYNFYKGTVLIHCGLDPVNRDRAEAEILSQLAALQRGDFTAEELAAAKSSLENSYRQLTDSPGAMESFYYGRALLGSTATIDSTRADFAKVTREDVIAAACGLRADTVYFLKGTLEEGGDEDEDDGV